MRRTITLILVLGGMTAGYYHYLGNFKAKAFQQLDSLEDLYLQAAVGDASTNQMQQTVTCITDPIQVTVCCI